MYKSIHAVMFMLNHFLYNIIMYYNYFSKGHNVETTFVQPYGRLTLLPMQKISEQSNLFPFTTMLNANIIIMIRYSINVTPETNIVISL